MRVHINMYSLCESAPCGGLATSKAGAGYASQSKTGGEDPTGDPHPEGPRRGPTQRRAPQGTHHRRGGPQQWTHTEHTQTFMSPCLNCDGRGVPCREESEGSSTRVKINALSDNETVFRENEPGKAIGTRASCHEGGEQGVRALKVPCAPKGFDSRVSNKQNDETLSETSLRYLSKANLPIALT